MSLCLKLKLITTKYIIGQYFETKLIMISITPSATKEGTKGLLKRPEGPWEPEGPQAFCSS